ncbi:MAG: hypothetical protein MZV70_08855 [Desulfobacterales bacterium]|nr:hypothetical protein [Desulfobacterales bacterium]
MFVDGIDQKVQIFAAHGPARRRLPALGGADRALRPGQAAQHLGGLGRPRREAHLLRLPQLQLVRPQAQARPLQAGRPRRGRHRLRRQGHQGPGRPLGRRHLASTPTSRPTRSDSKTVAKLHAQRDRRARPQAERDGHHRHHPHRHHHGRPRPAADPQFPLRPATARPPTWARPCSAACSTPATTAAGWAARWPAPTACATSLR